MKMDTILTNGVTYYKLCDLYPGDIRKGCSLVTDEIDQNFHVLRGYDIESFAVSEKKLILKRLNGDEMIVDLTENPFVTPENFVFKYNGEDGTITITYPDGETATISGFTTTIYTDSTIEGNGSQTNPLKLSRIEKTGIYAPANEYKEILSGNTLPTEGFNVGYRIVTKEIKNDFGNLYNQDGVNIISEYLEDSNNGWRIPTKEDWDRLLDSLEPSDYVELGFLPHSSTTIDYLGKDAAQHLKSPDFKHYDNPIQEDSTCGYDTLGMNIMPVGVALRDEYGQIHNEGFLETSVLWTASNFENGKYAKGFFFDTNKVLQSIGNEQFASIRFVKDYDGNNYEGYEEIFGQTYKTILAEKTSQIWTSTNVYFTKAQIETLEKYINFIDVIIDENNSNLINFKNTFYINEFDGNKWIKKELKEGDSIVILSRDIEDGVTKYYRKWTVKNGELTSFEDYVNAELEFMIEVFDSTIEEMRSTFNNKISALTETFENQINELTNDFTQSIETLSGELSTQITRIDERLETFINDELEGTIKDTVKIYIQDTTNEIKITETEDGKLKIGFSDNAIFG